MVVPCFNPPEGWSNGLVKKFEQLQTHLEGVSLTLILVNDGTTNNRFTEKEKKYITDALPHSTLIESKTNQGKGAALRKGVAVSKSDFQIFTDIDFPYTLPSIIAVYKTLIEGADVALGFRQSDYYESVPFTRKMISKWLRWLLKRVMKLPITDTQCGLKGFNKKGKEQFLATTIDRFLFDLEFVKLVTMKTKNLSVKPVAVKLREDVTFSVMNYQVLARESVNFFRLFFRR